MMLQVLDTNTKARRLYERLGGTCLNWLTARLYKPELCTLVDQQLSSFAGKHLEMIVLSNGAALILATNTKVIYREATKEDVPALLKMIKVACSWLLIADKECAFTCSIYL